MSQNRKHYKAPRRRGRPHMKTQIRAGRGVFHIDTGYDIVNKQTETVVLQGDIEDTMRIIIKKFGLDQRSLYDQY